MIEKLTISQAMLIGAAITIKNIHDPKFHNIVTNPWIPTNEKEKLLIEQYVQGTLQDCKRVDDLLKILWPQNKDLE